MINRFKITNLFGYKNINIDFEYDIKILIGENGLGKTTILNSLYFLLNKMYHKLIQIDFEKIELEFKGYKNISIYKYEIEEYLEYNKRGRKLRIPPKVIEELKNINLDELKQYSDYDDFNINARNIINRYVKEDKIRRFAPIDIMVREIYRHINLPKFENIKELENTLEMLNFSILYLPTYRRVEEDLNSLGATDTYFDDIEELDDDDMKTADDTLIHFGMEDVISRVIKVENEITKLTVNGFSKVTGEILSQFLKGFPKINDKAIDRLDVKTAEIILHRVGKNISKKDRDEILHLLQNKNELKEKRELVYFIFKLIDIYEQHKHLDDALKTFRDVCNEYLNDKEFRYDESSVNIDLYRTALDEIVTLNKLSSGEKQIISIFSKIYLQEENNLIVLFDEPELSLSLPWQKKLLPDIVKSKKCKLLLSVTHSPFIFDNELDKYAIGMNTYLSESIDEH
ncbi:AAA family ATPase [Arcobacter sp. F2176]|uniref:AAA family ATPase n=1 Tax=Arcobacter sp. F2176 TaxID=2044511 RepID=UPI00100B3C14|nr:AAA family ATPase [Arcobacter sp. F2176]RXJ79451.1 ATP/GTP-binding protein [Arcobacter sp. F2176]